MFRAIRCYLRVVARGDPVGFNGFFASNLGFKVVIAPQESEFVHVLEQSRNREEQEVRNAATLMHYVAEQVNQNPKAALTEVLIKDFHNLVTNNIAYPNNTPGHYRTFPVMAGDYLPPESGDEVRKLMNEFVEWFNKGTPQSWNPIIRAIAAHFFLISIHPFGDGNGRTSRALESYLLYQARVNARGFYSLSNYYYRKRPEYVASLGNVRFHTDPNLTPFVEFAFGRVG